MNDTKLVNSEQEKYSKQRQNEALLPERGITSVGWMWFGMRCLDTDQKTILCKLEKEYYMIGFDVFDHIHI